MHDTKFTFRATQPKTPSRWMLSDEDGERIWNELLVTLPGRSFTPPLNEEGKILWKRNYPEHLAFLEEVFERTQYVNNGLVNHIARLFNMKPKRPGETHQIEGWFDRKRLELEKFYKQYDVKAIENPSELFPDNLVKEVTDEELLDEIMKGIEIPPEWN